MEIFIPSQLASAFFITDPRGLAILPSHGKNRIDIVIIHGECSIASLAGVFDELRNEKLGVLEKIFFGNPKKITIEEGTKFLSEISNDNTGFIFHTLGLDLVPMLILAESWDEKLLRALKIAKVRGIWEIAGVTCLKSAMNEVVDKLAIMYHNRNSSNDHSRTVLSGLQGVKVMCNLEKTIISASTHRSILKKHPDMIQGVDMNVLFEKEAYLLVPPKQLD